jgi:hypothetical protein
VWSFNFSLEVDTDFIRRNHLLQQRGVSTSTYRGSENGSSEKLKLHAAEAGGI